jgi:hypothetical protein
VGLPLYPTGLFLYIRFPGRRADALFVGRGLYLKPAEKKAVLDLEPAQTTLRFRFNAQACRSHPRRRLLLSHLSPAAINVPPEK